MGKDNEIKTDKQTAIREVIKLKKYNDLNYNLALIIHDIYKGNYNSSVDNKDLDLYNYYGGDKNYFKKETDKTIISIYKNNDFNKGKILFNKLEDLYNKDYITYEALHQSNLTKNEILTSLSLDFGNAIKKRIETRVILKQGGDLFPENANVKEYKPIKKTKKMSKNKIKNADRKKTGTLLKKPVKKKVVKKVVKKVEPKKIEAKKEVKKSDGQIKKTVITMLGALVGQLRQNKSTDYAKYHSKRNRIVKRLTGVNDTEIKEFFKPIFTEFEKGVKNSIEIKKTLDKCNSFKKGTQGKKAQGLKENNFSGLLGSL